MGYYNHALSAKLAKSVTYIYVAIFKGALLFSIYGSDFNSEWRKQVETKVSTCMRSSILCEDEYLDGKLHKREIEKYIYKLKNNKTSFTRGSSIYIVYAYV